MGSSYVGHFEDYLRVNQIKFKSPFPVRFISVGGLSILELEALMRQHLSPSGSGYLILQVGGNDVGKLSGLAWRQELETAILFARARFPNYTIIWSDMFQRNNWRHCANVWVGVNKRQRLQRYARRIVTNEGGRVFKHPLGMHKLLKGDGVHLSPVGNDTLKHSLERQIKRLR